MKEVNVKASQSYKVYIEKNLKEKLSDMIIRKESTRYLILTDENVYRLHFESLKENLEKTGLELIEYVIKPGEDSKSFESLFKLLEFMAEKNINSNDILIAFGGGVVGDLGGFAAAIYRRGIDYIQIPTSLLAQVDSSVGGKTAVNLTSAKNMVGSFKQPLAVYCDTSFLETLEKEEFSCGMGEVIKYGILFDRSLFDKLIQKVELDKNFDQIIESCIKLKRDVVEEDEFDNSKRQLLNLGHTLAHAIEIQSDHKIKHGQAVAIGTCMISRSCYKRNILSKKDLDLIERSFKNNDLEISTEIKIDQMIEQISKDKKRRGSYINEILIRQIGDSYLEKFDLKELEEFLKEGQE